MAGAHDLGGAPGTGPIDKSQHDTEDWERLADAVTVVLDKKGIKTTDEHRRAQESLDPERYRNLSYYERWVAATEMLLVEKGVLTREEIDEKADEIGESGDKREVRSGRPGLHTCRQEAWPRPHSRLRQGQGRTDREGPGRV